MDYWNGIVECWPSKNDYRLPQYAIIICLCFLALNAEFTSSLQIITNGCQNRLIISWPGLPYLLHPLQLDNMHPPWDHTAQLLTSSTLSASYWTTWALITTGLTALRIHQLVKQKLLSTILLIRLKVGTKHSNYIIIKTIPVFHSSSPFQCSIPVNGYTLKIYICKLTIKPIKMYTL